MKKPIVKRSAAAAVCLLMALAMWTPSRAASDKLYENVLKATLGSIHETITNPKYGSIGGEWAVITLARGGLEDDAWYGRYLDQLLATVNSAKGSLHGEKNKYTEYSRVILALSSLGLDATKLNTGSQVYDLVSPLLTRQDNGQYWASSQGNNGTIFAIIALDSQGYFYDDNGKTVRADLLDALLTAQSSDGGWSISTGKSDIDTPAMALQALAPYYLNEAKFKALGASHTYEDLRDSVEEALQCLDTIKMNGKTAKDNDYFSAEAAAQVVVALAALDWDPDDPRLDNALSSVLAYYDGNGGFLHESDDDEADQMSTEQACYALVAYDRWKKHKNTLYDMADRPLVSAIHFTAPTAASVEQTASGIFTVTCQYPCAVIAVLTDGSYARLTSTGSGNTRKFHSVNGSVIVTILGDVNGDGRFNGSDVTDAKAAFLGKAKLDAIQQMAADVDNSQRFNGSDVTLIKAAFLGKDKLSW